MALEPAPRPIRPVLREAAVARYIAQQSPTPQPEFIDTLRQLWRQRALILALTVLCAAVTGLVAVFLPPQYVAEARVRVGVPVPHALKIESVLADVSVDADHVQDEALAVQSRGVAKDVLAQLSLLQNPEFNLHLRSNIPKVVRILSSVTTLLPRSVADWLDLDGSVRASKTVANSSSESRQNDAIDVLLSKVNVNILGRSHVLSIQAAARDPAVAAAIANSFAGSYLSHQRQSKIDANKEVEDFLAGRIAELRQQVDASERAVEEFRKKNGLFYTSANTGVATQQLSELNTQLILADTARAEANARLREAQAVQQGGLEGDSVPEVLRSPLIQSLKDQQITAERHLAELLASHGDQHPKVISAKAEINDIRKKVRTEVGHVIEGLRHEARTTNTRYSTMRQNFEQIKEQMGGVNEKTIELSALEREATVSRHLLENILSRAKETIGQQDIQRANATLISEAVAPNRPSFPPKSLLVFLGALAGGLLGCIAALLRDKFDQTFRSGAQVESVTGLRTLAMVPNLKRGLVPTAHVLRKPLSTYAEALRKLYVGLELSEVTRVPKLVLFCSATPGEGKSVLVASLGRLLASNGKRVLLIDFDWRRPELHRLFRFSNRGGLGALFADGRMSLHDVIFNDALSGVDVIPAGEIDPRSMHLLTSDRMRVILQTFAKNYDLILLDTPPILAGAEVMTLCRMVDKVIFTVRWGHTRQTTALSALKQVLETQADVAGVVLSRVDPKRCHHFADEHVSYAYEGPPILLAPQLDEGTS